ncbi:MAG: TetR/AcrR family transcriptional regulator [Paenibacillus sp.]|nr:TetR/AcrR family transcriptional regulator [Paenibacillus sp.]
MQIRKERKDAVEHRALILKTAHSLFALNGPDGVSMHQIAKSAGIGQGTLYRRYANKSDLCLDLIQDSCFKFIENCKSLLLQQQALPPLDRMANLLDTWVDFIEEKSHWLGVIQSASYCEANRSLYYHSPVYIFLHTTIMNLLEEYAAISGRIDLDRVLTAHAILSSMDPNMYNLLRREHDYSAEQIKRSLRQLFLKPLAL